MNSKDFQIFSDKQLKYLRQTDDESGMDTVTESEITIAIAREGCISMIHKNMTIVEYARDADRVKIQANDVISN